MKFSSKFILIFCLVIMTCIALFFYPKWQKNNTEATLSWDVSGYYLYLPAIFIYKDLKQCHFLDSIIVKYSPTNDKQQVFRDSFSHNMVMKYSIGQAIAMVPFFSLAHFYTTQLSPLYLADGFSFPYQLSIGLGMFLYSILGLVFLRKILLNYFKDNSVSILLVFMVFGTNYLEYFTISHAMTHTTLFLIFTGLLLCSIQFYKNPTYSKSIIIGSLVGFAVLVRPSEAIFILIPLLWDVRTLVDFKRRYKFWKSHYLHLTFIVTFILLLFSIQITYWYLITSKLLVYSYQDQTFTWLNPHIYEFMFNSQSGWIRHCPLMLLVLMSLVFYFFSKRKSIAILSYLALNFYIVTSWDFWNYGCYSGRAMLTSYVCLAFPFTHLIEWVSTKSYSVKTFFYFSIGLCVIYNLWWTYHLH